MSDVVAGALRDAFPERVVRSAVAVPGSERPGNAMVRVSFEEGADAYLKVSRSGSAAARERLAREAGVLAYARSRAGVRVPRVLAADPDGEPAFVATAVLPGTAIATDWPAASTVARATVLRAVGRALAGVHAVDFQEHAHIHGGDANSLDTTPGPWPEILAETLEQRASELFAERFRDLPDRTIDAIETHRTRLAGVPATLVHDDPRPENCLVDSDGPGLVDWETALVGDPALDVVRAEAQYVERADVDDDAHDRLRRALRAGYRDHAGRLPDGFSDRHALYRVVTFLDTARTFEHWAPDAPEPVDDLADWVREAFDARLAAVEPA